MTGLLLLGKSDSLGRLVPTAKATFQVLEGILQCVTTEEAVRKLDACGKKDAVMQELLSKIMFYLNKRAAGKMQIEVILYSNEFGELAKSAGAEKFLQELM